MSPRVFIATRSNGAGVIALAMFRVIALVTALIFGTACPTPEPQPGEAARRAFTTRVTDEIALPLLADFVARATALRIAAASGEREAAQAAWREAMVVWQGLEVLQLGPAGSPSSFVAGAGLRDRIYAWPQVNLCAVDQQLFVNAFNEEGWAELRLPNVIGLAPLEYVLFVDTVDNACSSSVALNADGSWAALGADEIAARRAAYAAVLAANIEALATSLSAAWTSPGGFAETLRTAGEAGSAFSTAQQALDELYAALFAIELLTKDKKLGVPSGLHVDCAADACPEAAESRFSRTSKENIVVNLETTRRVLLGIDREGEDGPGFDDLLRDRGADDLATSMTANLDAAIAATRSFDGTLEDALATDPARVRELYQSVKGFTDDLKSSFQSTLGLRVPDEGAGDND